MKAFINTKQNLNIGLGTIRTLRKTVCTEWQKTKSADLGVSEPLILDPDSEGGPLEGQRAWTQGRHVVSQVGDICKIGCWVFFKFGAGDVTRAGRNCLESSQTLDVRDTDSHSVQPIEPASEGQYGDVQLQVCITNIQVANRLKF